ncbi:MAG: pyridoxal phosphate-dependent aminotransferase [Candidatus Sumerlaeia bacterium]
MPLTRLAREWADTPPNRLSEELEIFRSRGVRIIDLVTANPHEHGLTFPQEELLGIAAAGMVRAAVYRPDPLGQRPAREAVAAFYKARGAEADPQRIVLTAGTSLAYFYAIQLLADPGMEILAPEPGYPVFDDIAALCGVALRRYHLRVSEGRWRLDIDDLTFQITPRTRAVIVVSPHNPTGMVMSNGEWSALGALCRERRLPVVADEVFSEFLAPPLATLPRPEPGAFPLLITLNGLSKMLSLPGWKVAWMKVEGDPKLVEPFLKALERLSDAFLPVNELAQAMVPDLLRSGLRGAIERLARDYTERRSLVRRVLEWPQPPEPEGGVYLCVRLAGSADDEEFALRALREQHVLVHPGYLYNMPGYIVFTCVPRPEILVEGLTRLNKMI